VHETQVPQKLDFKPLAECVLNPDFSRDPNGMGGVFDFDKFGRPDLLHLIFLAIDDYVKETGSPPPAHDIAGTLGIVVYKSTSTGNACMDIKLTVVLVTGCSG
jgi:hypothetical protein